VKTIKNRKFIRVYAFAFVIMLILLLSPMIGTTAGKKPVNPGKSVKTWDLKIRIGLENEDIVLISSDHEDQEGFYLFAEDVPCSGGLWDLPSEKGNPRTRGWAGGALYLYKQPVEVEPGEWAWVGDSCGTYQLVAVPDKIDPDLLLSSFYDPTDNVTVGVIIEHQITPPRDGYPDGEDYWTFRLEWADDSDPDPSSGVTIYTLRAQTADGPGEEVTLDGAVWTVQFIGVVATLESYIMWGPNPPVDLWSGTVSFTLEISRKPHGTT